MSDKGSHQEPPLPPDLDWLEQLSEEDDGDLVAVADYGPKRSNDETARMFKLRRNLDQLDSLHRQKEHGVLKTREELKLCSENVKSLEKQRDTLEEQIDQQKAADNSVAVFRLRTQHKHLCQKLQSEEELEGRIDTELKLLKRELNELEVELSRFSSLRQELQEEERLFQDLKVQKAATRLRQERDASRNIQLKIQQLKDKQVTMKKKEERECLKETEEHQANRRITDKYLKETRKRLHQEEAEKEEQNRQLQEKRIQVVESLKSNIAATHESLRIKQSRAKANAQEKEQREKLLRESLDVQGINSLRHMHQKKQLETIKQQQEEFEEKQKSKKVIVEKNLQREQLVKSRTRQQAKLPNISGTDKLSSLRRVGDSLLHYLEPRPPSAREERATAQLRDTCGLSSSDDEEPEETMRQEEDQLSLTDSLAQPECSGLWDEKYKKLLNEKTTLVQTEVKQEEAVMTSGKLNVPAKPVHGKKWKGPLFISKPEVILFKDFEVGKTYKKKFVLTNTSYTKNHCKLLGLSAQLKDFITINFKPAGSLSVGMSCEMQAVFQPMLNEDLEGDLHFSTAAGPFFVPVRCTIKKCELEVDSQLVDFGSHVVGQTISRTITLTNKGALATLFSLDTSTWLSPESHHVQMPSPVSAPTCQETSSQKTKCGSQKSSGEIRTKQERQKLCEAAQQEKPGEVSEGSAVSPEVIPEATDAELKLDEDTSDISLGNVREGEIGIFESIKLEVVFAPTVPGEATLDFHIKFSDQSSKPIPIHVRGNAVSIPVWVDRPTVDLKICMFDRLYQDTVAVHSRASAALKVTFDVCPEMRKHMKLLPKTGFIQAQSSFNAQLKFLPRLSLSKDAPKYFDSDTGVLEVPMTVQVAGQVQPVHFTVQAVVTCTDLRFEPTEVDFGYCSVFHSVRSRVRLSNLSLLPQEFGFLGVPEFIEVQPNDGFGTLLPQETLDLDLILSANEAREYNFQLTCKTEINRDFLLSCRAVGVRPPLELSHSLIQFRATALCGNSQAIIYLTNPHANRNQSKQPVTPVVRDVTTPERPRLFSFTLPKDSDISITPAAGRLLPGQRCKVQVTFRPRLLEQDIREEALRVLQRAKLLRQKELEMKRLTEQETKKEIPVESAKGKKSPANRKHSKKPDEPKRDQQSESPNPLDIQPGSEHYEQARASLLCSVTQRWSDFIVPCFVSDGDQPDDDRQAPPTWSAFNTLYLKLQCPAVRPSLVVISNNGHSVIDFHQVAVGQRVLKKFTVQNISNEPLDLRTSLLDIHGPISLLNALRCIRPGGKHTLLFAFSPEQEKTYCETLDICDHKMSLEVTLRGEGVVPDVTSSHPGGLLDFGCVLEKESTSQVVKLHNNSAVEVGFRVLLASLSPPRPQSAAEIVAVMLGDYTDSEVRPIVGTQNYSGQSVFSAGPVKGNIAPGQSQDITVTFQPDHQSVKYSDELTIHLMNKTEVCVMDLKGAASSNNMYLHGGDVLNVPFEPLLLPLTPSQAQPKDESEGSSEPRFTVLVTLRARCSGGAITPAVRELQVGCISSNKKSGEFYLDNVASLQQQGFSIEPSKGTVEAGHTRTIKVTWIPHSGHKPYEVVQTCVPLTVKGDEKQVYRVTLMAFVSHTAD
ncbi:cilia- and flagella-associated protein 74 [Platichthys flesus]|uniref:cilia- and flagella-associated protein 74 n=1 Tax=Platichthys flesus TaxID=8260 RepID=UPI002DBBD6DE|nr:cilia- and flagella-associated protein 74 [Platichthys flesus]